MPSPTTRDEKRSTIQFSIYLVREVLKDRAGVEHCFRERRLIRQSPDDKVLAVIEAPEGTWIRNRRDVHGAEQLMIPTTKGRWPVRWIQAECVPAKYVINFARIGAHGLSLVSYSGDPSTGRALDSDLRPIA